MDFLNKNWDQFANGTWYGNFNHRTPMWAVYKGLELNIGLGDTSTITSLRDLQCDTAARARPFQCLQLVAGLQRLAGVEPGGERQLGRLQLLYGNLATAFYLPILGGTEIPVPYPSGHVGGARAWSSGSRGYASRKAE